MFEFVPDRVVGEHLQLSRGGVLSLEMRFGAPLAKSISVILLACYDSYLQIFADRNIIANSTVTQFVVFRQFYFDGSPIKGQSKFMLK